MKIDGQKFHRRKHTRFKLYYLTFLQQIYTSFRGMHTEEKYNVFYSPYQFELMGFILKDLILENASVP